MFRLLRSKITTLALAVFLVWFGLLSLNVDVRHERLRMSLDDMERKIRNTERSNTYMAQYGDYLKSEAFLEKQTRLRLNYKAPDEQVVFVYRAGSGETPVPQPALQARPASGDSETAPFWERLWGYLLGKLK